MTGIGCRDGGVCGGEGGVRCDRDGVQGWQCVCVEGGVRYDRGRVQGRRGGWVGGGD